MGSVTKFAAAIGFAGAAAALCAFPAEAGCKRMAFSVNDYGKDGPTKDSQDLLDKHIANWAAEQGIEKYTVGKKDVSCELFLNLIVVDEHTCTARATVCWGGDKLPATQEAKTKAPEKAVAKADATGDAAAPAKSKEPAKETKAADAKPADTKPVESKPAEAKASEAKPSEPAHSEAKSAATAPVETGALPLTNKPAESAASTPAATPAKAEADTFSVSDRDAVAAAAAAAERAAAAAERAAAAAERAAAAATEQAAIAAKAQQAAANSATPTPPAYGAPSQPVVAPIQPDASAKP